VTVPELRGPLFDRGLHFGPGDFFLLRIRFARNLEQAVPTCVIVYDQFVGHRRIEIRAVNRSPQTQRFGMPLQANGNVILTFPGDIAHFL